MGIKSKNNLLKEEDIALPQLDIQKKRVKKSGNQKNPAFVYEETKAYKRLTRALLIDSQGEDDPKFQKMQKEMLTNLSSFKSHMLNAYGQEKYKDALVLMNKALITQHSAKETIILKRERESLLKAFSRWNNENELPMLLGFLEKSGTRERYEFLRDTGMVSRKRFKHVLKENFSINGLSVMGIKTALIAASGILVLEAEKLNNMPGWLLGACKLAIPLSIGSAFLLYKQSKELPKVMEDMENNHLTHLMPPSFMNKKMSGEESFKEVEKALKEVGLYKKKALKYASPSMLRLFTDIYNSVKADASFDNIKNKPVKIGEVSYKILQDSHQQYAEKLLEYKSKMNRVDNLTSGVSMILELGMLHVGGHLVIHALDHAKHVLGEKVLGVLKNFNEDSMAGRLSEVIEKALHAQLKAESASGIIIEKVATEIADKSIDVSKENVNGSEKHKENNFYVANINQVLDKFNEAASVNQEKIERKKNNSFFKKG